MVSADTSAQLLKDFAERSEARLRGHFDRWRSELPQSKAPVSTSDLFNQVVDLTLRPAKRLRPALAYYTALCFDHQLSDVIILDSALSVELLQSALLIHDDIMDADLSRRGGPTVHVEMTKATGDPHEGNSLALLAGGIAYALSERILLEAGLPNLRYVAANAELIRMKYEVLYGQLLDMVGGAEPEVIHRWKTSSYTTQGPMRLGAAVGGAKNPDVVLLEGFSNPLGRAFQMRDDMLGVFGDSAKTGKAVGADLRAGKNTDLVQWVREHGTKEQIAALDSVFKQPGADQQAVDTACEAIEASGARQHVQAQIETFSQEAVAALDKSSLRPVGARFLRGIASLLAQRDR